MNGIWPKVLIIDDHPASIEWLRGVLDKKAYNVHFARSADEGIRCAIEFRPELIICDWVMPVKDGLEFGRMAREDPRLRDIPKILITGKEAKVEDWGLASKAGYCAIIRKPFDPDEYVQQLVDHMKPNKMREMRALMLRDGDDGTTR